MTPTMEKASDNKANACYNDETLFLDGTQEFHPEVFESLSPEDQQILKEYYLIGSEEEIENIFSYRSNLLDAQPLIEAQAKTAFDKVLNQLGIKEFTYSTKSEED